MFRTIWSGAGILFVCLMLFILKTRFDSKLEEAKATATAGASGPSGGRDDGPRNFATPTDALCLYARDRAHL